MKLLVSVALLLFLSLPSAAQTYPCCQCRDRVTGQLFYSITAFGDCKTNCSANSGTAVNNVPGPCPPGTANLQDLQKHVVWSIAKAGALVWTGNQQETLIRGGHLREVLANKQDPNEFSHKAGYATIMAAPQTLLEEKTVAALEQCKRENDIWAHLVWVRNNFGLQYALWNAYTAGDVMRIRTIYHDTQAKYGDKNNANLLNCHSGPDVLNMVRLLGDPGPEPQPNDNKPKPWEQGGSKETKPISFRTWLQSIRNPEALVTLEKSATDAQRKAVTMERRVSEAQASAKRQRLWLLLAVAVALVIGVLVGRRMR